MIGNYPAYSRQQFETKTDPEELRAHYNAREIVSKGKIDITTLPASIIGTRDESNEVTSWGIMQHCEQFVYKHVDPDIVFTRPEISRFGTPIVMLPQIRRYHQFPSEDHSLITSYVAHNAGESLLPMFHPDLAEFIGQQIDGEAEYLAMGGYLHDIEKLFADTYRAYDRNEPWNHSGPYHRGEPLLHIWKDFELQESIGITRETSMRDAKRLLIEHFLAGDTSKPLGSIVPTVSPELDTEKLKTIMEIYLAIDEAIIGVWVNPRLSGVPRKGNVDRIISKLQKQNFDPRLLTMACLLVVSDNIAQGIPAEHGPLFPAHQRINLYIATNLIYSAYCNAQ
jgi:hypothetical protein